MIKESTKTDISNRSPYVFEKLREEALDLEMVDKFLASVEQKNRLISGMPFDSGRLHRALTELAAQRGPDESIGFEEAELIAESELASWREILEMRNNMIETYHIRRFYDHSDVPLDLGLLVSLMRVFHSLPYSEANQSKYDLVVTRLFTKGSAETMRSLRLPREKIAGALDTLLPRYPESLTEGYVETVVEEFDRFIATLKPLSDLEEFIERDAFEVLRCLKKDLGRLLFHPQVSAAAVESNITIGNIFAGLVNRVNGPLYELLNNKFDFAGAFHDVSPTAIANLWEEFHREETGDQSMPYPERIELKELLEMIGGGNTRGTPENDDFRNLMDVGTEAEVHAQSASDRVNEFLLLLNNENPDYTLIRAKLDKYMALMSIDLEYILGGTSKPVTDICREVLALIMWTEELCANDLQLSDYVSARTKSKASTLIQLSERYQQDLEEMLEEVEHTEQNRLLTVSNRLLACHLDLKRMLVQFTQKHLEESEIVTH